LNPWANADSPRRRELFSRPSVSFDINRAPSRLRSKGAKAMNGIIYIIGLIVVIMAILSFFGLR
jgi:hypothetical protein